MSNVPPLLDDDEYAKGRTSSSGNSRCAVTEARSRLDVLVKLEVPS